MEYDDTMTRNIALNSLLNVYCRIGPSKVNGVGVIAIRTIPEGFNPFISPRDMDVVKIPSSEIKESVAISASQKQLVKDMCVEDDGFYYLPFDGLNELGVAWYLNHSKEPNMETQDGVEFFALRQILAGEELVVDYSTYGEVNI